MNTQDVINRQDAIKALEQGFKEITKGVDKLSPTYGLTKAVTGIYKCYIGRLLPAQSEIVRCEECKYHQRNCPIEKYFSLDGFCSRGERKEVTECSITEIEESYISRGTLEELKAQCAVPTLEV